MMLPLLDTSMTKPADTMAVVTRGAGGRQMLDSRLQHLGPGPHCYRIHEIRAYRHREQQLRHSLPTTGNKITGKLSKITDRIHRIIDRISKINKTKIDRIHKIIDKINKTKIDRIRKIIDRIIHKTMCNSFQYRLTLHHFIRSMLKDKVPIITGQTRLQLSVHTR
jgi:hypothetical protein